MHVPAMPLVEPRTPALPCRDARAFHYCNRRVQRRDLRPRPVVDNGDRGAKLSTAVEVTTELIFDETERVGTRTVNFSHVLPSLAPVKRSELN